MKRKTKSLVRRIAAATLAVLIIMINFLPAAALAQGNFNPGTFSPGTFTPGTFTPGTFTPGTFTPGTFTPGEFTPGDFTPGEFTPGEFSPGETNPGEMTPGTFTPGTFSPGTFTPGTFTPGETDPGTTNPGNATPGVTSPGQWNPSIIDPNNPNSNLNGPYGQGYPGFVPGSPYLNNPLVNTPGMNPIYGPYVYTTGEENGPVINFKDHEGYNTLKFIANDVLTPGITAIDGESLSTINWRNYDIDKVGISVNAALLKSQLPKLFPGSSGWQNSVDVGIDVYDGVQHASHLSSFLNLTEVRNAWSTFSLGGSFSSVSGGSSAFANITKPLNMGTGIAGKVTPWMAGISTGISGAETIMNFSNGDVNEGISSLGETLMSGAVVLSATGVGAPIAAGVALTGGLLWAGSKVYKHWGKITNGAKKIGDGIKNAWNWGTKKLGSLFS